MLIISDSGIGDFILQSAAIREIRRLYPGAHITLIISANAFNLAECCPYIDELIAKQRAQFFGDEFRINALIASNLLKRRFDICYSFTQYSGIPFLAYMSGARIRVTNFCSGNGFLFPDIPLEYSIKLATHIFSENIQGDHIVDKWLSLIDNMLHVPSLNRKIEVWYTPADYSIATSLLPIDDKNFYALCMGGSRPMKHYSLEKYARLLEMILADEPTATFVILGGGQNDLRSAAIIKNIVPHIYEKNIIDLTNKTTLRQSAAVLSLCKMYIGNDTSTMHLAAAVGCPCLSPNAFADDLPKTFNDDIIYVFSPYDVPSVVVRPQNALPECKNARINGLVTNTPQNYGCVADFPHCITQIEPETLFRGFKLLKDRVAAGINESLYIH